MSFPIVGQVGLRVRELGAKDAHGNAVESFAPAVSVDIHGWSAQGPTESVEASRTVTPRRIDLLAPAWSGVAGDHVEGIPGAPGTWRQVGEMSDYGHGPFGWAAGVVVVLELVEVR